MLKIAEYLETDLKIDIYGKSTVSVAIMKKAPFTGGLITPNINEQSKMFERTTKRPIMIRQSIQTHLLSQSPYDVFVF